MMMVMIIDDTENDDNDNNMMMTIFGKIAKHLMLELPYGYFPIVIQMRSNLMKEDHGGNLGESHWLTQSKKR